MRSGTRIIVDRLKRSKAVPITPAQWGDLVDDVLNMGRDAFLTALNNSDLAKVKKSSRPKPDEFVERVERYRKKSGLSSRDFARELHARIANNLPEPPPSSALASTTKYLSYARVLIGDADLETVCANVTNTFA